MLSGSDGPKGNPFLSGKWRDNEDCQNFSEAEVEQYWDTVANEPDKTPYDYQQEADINHRTVHTAAENETYCGKNNMHC